MHQREMFRVIQLMLTAVAQDTRELRVSKPSPALVTISCV
jgi:hypothetical protein